MNQTQCNSKDVGTPRYLSLVVPLRKVGDEAVHKELGGRMEKELLLLLLAMKQSMTLVYVNAAMHQLLLLVQVPAAKVNPIIYTLCIQQFWATAQVKMVNGVRQLQALIDKKKVIITEASIRNDLHLDDTEGTDCLPNTTIFEELAKMGSGKDSIPLTDSTQIPIIDQPSTSSQPKKKQKSRRKQRKDAETAHAKTEEEEHFNTPSNDPLPSDAEVTLVNEQQNEDLIFDIGVLDDDEVFVDVASSEKNEKSTKLDDSTTGEAVTTTSVEDSVAPIIQVSTADIGEVTATKIDELTLAQTLIEINAAKPKVVTIAATTTTTTRSKGKGVVVQEQIPLKRKDQIALDEQIVSDIQAKLDAELEEEHKLARKQEEEANIALIDSWENTKAMMEADRLLAERLQSKEREELTDGEKGKLFMELMEKRRKHFATLRA
ncbi:hypothetical protein Tco_0839672 [Tanacetum coccineum]|uniref:Uncharacterized protein n=1 Tax=Tanacetum coccineum TaxID=301880 RepID=A0ABQ5ARA9_9ASTR